MHIPSKPFIGAAETTRLADTHNFGITFSELFEIDMWWASLQQDGSPDEMQAFPQPQQPLASFRL